jgi:hypothetical protein
MASLRTARLKKETEMATMPEWTHYYCQFLCGGVARLCFYLAQFRHRNPEKGNCQSEHSS